jgi:hypothetical protein
VLLSRHMFLGRAGRPSHCAACLFWLCAGALLSGGAAAPAQVRERVETAESYIAAHGGDLAPAGRLEIDGRVMGCGSLPTVLDPKLDDFGASYPGFVVLNTRLFAGLSTAVKLWIFSHECAHQTAGTDEARADCAAVKRGRHEGWLTADGLRQVCAFMQPARGDRSHFTGTQRCALMTECFKR